MKQIEKIIIVNDDESIDVVNNSNDINIISNYLSTDNYLLHRSNEECSKIQIINADDNYFNNLKQAFYDYIDESIFDIDLNYKLSQKEKDKMEEKLKSDIVSFIKEIIEDFDIDINQENE